MNHRTKTQRRKRRFKMRKLFTTGALFLAVSLIPAALPTHAQSTPDAQSPPPAQDNGAMMAAKTPPTTVTGCIAAGKKDGTFKLTADDGTVYMLRSRNTNFAEHVGHTVTVTGRVLTGQGGANGAAPSNSGDSSRVRRRQSKRARGRLRCSHETRRHDPPDGPLHDHGQRNLQSEITRGRNKFRAYAIPSRAKGARDSSRVSFLLRPIEPYGEVRFRRTFLRSRPSRGARLMY